MVNTPLSLSRSLSEVDVFRVLATEHVKVLTALACGLFLDAADTSSY